MNDNQVPLVEEGDDQDECDERDYNNCSSLSTLFLYFPLTLAAQYLILEYGDAGGLGFKTAGLDLKQYA